jgi:hypothetical protein
MREDLIDLLTKYVFYHNDIANIVNGMCRICTKDEERAFVMKISELADVNTSNIGLSKYFTLDENSEIR